MFLSCSYFRVFIFVCLHRYAATMPNQAVRIPEATLSPASRRAITLTSGTLPLVSLSAARRKRPGVATAAQLAAQRLGGACTDGSSQARRASPCMAATRCCNLSTQRVVGVLTLGLVATFAAMLLWDIGRVDGPPSSSKMAPALSAPPSDPDTASSVAALAAKLRPLVASTPSAAPSRPLDPRDPLCTSLEAEAAWVADGGGCNGTATVWAGGYFACDPGTRATPSRLCVVNDVDRLPASAVVADDGAGVGLPWLVNGAPYPHVARRMQGRKTIILRDAVVAPTGAVFNRWLFLRTTRWYYTLPSVHRRLQGPRLPAAVSLVMTWSDSFQHFVMDTLTKADTVMDLVRSDPSLHIVGMPGLGFRLLQRAWPWVHPSRFVTLGERTVQAVDALYFPIVVGPSRMGDVPVGSAFSKIAPAFTEAACDWGQSQPLPPPRTTLLYLGRAASRHRSVDNQAALLEALTSALRPVGLQLEVLIDPVEANVTSTCRAVQRAVGVIGPHGGALANAIFMQPGGHVIELGPNPDDLAPDEAMRECFTGMANGMTNTSYWRVPPLPPFRYNTSFAVSITDVLHTLGRAGIISQ